MRRGALVVAMSLPLVLAGCFRTQYLNLHTRPAPEHAEHERTRVPPQYWRSFWVYGLAPGELVINGHEQCGGVAHIQRIETRQSFVQGLIEAFAGYYINIYSPYTGRVVCDHWEERELPSDEGNEGR